MPQTIEVDPSQVHSIEVSPDQVSAIAAAAKPKSFSEWLTHQAAGFNNAIGENLESVGQMAVHLIPGVANLQHWQAAKDAFDQGDYRGALTHAFEASQPLAGAIDLAAQAKGQSASKLKSAYQNVTKGKISNGVDDAITSVPIVGPLIESVAHDVDTGEYGHLTGTIGVNAVMPEISEGLGGAAQDLVRIPGRVQNAALGKIQASATAPLSPGAIALADQHGIPLNAYDLTGSKALNSVGETLGNSVATDQFLDQNAAKQKGLNALAQKQAGGYAQDQYSAGQTVLNGMLETAADHDAKASEGYQAFEEAHDNPANSVEVPTGKTRTVAGSSVLGPDGKPLVPAREVPETESVALPVDVSGTRASVNKILDELTTGVPEADQRLDPVRAVAKDLSNGSQYIAARRAEKFVGFLKDATGKGSNASAMAKMLANRLIDQLQPAVDAAADKAGVLDALKQGRENTRLKYEALETAKSLSGDITGKSGQVQTAQGLLQPKDASLPALQNVLQIRPDLKAPLAEAYLTSRVFDQAAEGADYADPAKARAAWKAMGPRTKALLFSAEQIRDINDGLELAERIAENPNAKFSKVYWSVLKLGGLIVHPVGTAATIGIGRSMAKAFLNPNRAKLMRTGVEKLGTPEGAAALSQLRDQPLQQQQSGPEAPEVGPDGPVFRDLKGQDAVDKLRQLKTGDAIGAFSHRLFPSIDLIHGKATPDLGPGERPYGLAHIDEEHPGVADRLQRILDGMDQVKSQGDRHVLSNSETGDRVVLAQTRKGQPKNWVLTAYGKDQPLSGKIRDASEGQTAGETTPAPQGQSVPIIGQTPAAHNISAPKLAEPDTPAELTDGRSELTPPSADLGESQLKAEPQAGDVVKMDPREIVADPARFQFKRDTGGAAGVGDELKSVKKYDPEMGGILSVWRDPADGKTYVVNGHHRLELAKRAGAPEVAVRYLDAQGANEARTKGALINMAEGRGTPIDAAKVLRDEHMTPEQLAEKGVSLKGAVARDGAHLSRLSGPIFDRVVSGDTPVNRAALIGEKLPNHADQAAALQMLERAETGGRSVSNDVFRELIDMVAGAPKKESAAAENMSLFGDMEPEQESTALEMAKLSDYVRKKLTTEKRLFGTVADAGKSKVLQEAGNQLVDDVNGQKAEGAAQALAAYDKLKALSGPVNTAIRNGAASLGKKGAPVKEIQAHTYERVRQAIEQELGGVPEIRDARRPPDDRTGNLFTGEIPEESPRPKSPAARPTPELPKQTSEVSTEVSKAMSERMAFAVARMTDDGPSYDALFKGEKGDPSLARWHKYPIQPVIGTAYVVNAHGFDLAMRSIGWMDRAAKSAATFLGGNIAPSLGRRLDMLVRAQGLSINHPIAQFAFHLMGKKGPVILIQDFRGLGELEFATNAQHEFFHAIQEACGRPSEADINRFLKSPIGRTADLTLSFAGYGDYSKAAMVDEIGVRLMQSGNGKQLGISPQAFSLLKEQYRSILPRDNPEFRSRILQLLRESTYEQP